MAFRPHSLVHSTYVDMAHCKKANNFGLARCLVVGVLLGKQYQTISSTVCVSYFTSPRDSLTTSRLTEPGHSFADVTINGALFCRALAAISGKKFSTSHIQNHTIAASHIHPLKKDQAVKWWGFDFCSWWRWSICRAV